jgi:hypothetical protein
MEAGSPKNRCANKKRFYVVGINPYRQKTGVQTNRMDAAASPTFGKKGFRGI